MAFKPVLRGDQTAEMTWRKLIDKRALSLVNSHLKDKSWNTFKLGTSGGGGRGHCSAPLPSQTSTLCPYWPTNDDAQWNSN